MGVPYWVTDTARKFLDPDDGMPMSHNWTEDDPSRWSKVVNIHYPPNAFVYYVVDALRPEHKDARPDGWYELPGTHMIQELADNTAWSSGTDRNHNAIH
jgi:hypothetical protein